MDLWHDISLGDEAPDVLNAIIEIPKGSNVKYEIDKDTGLISVDRFLHSAVYYPGDYGFFPRTYCDDGDPLDVLIITNIPILPGTLVRVRPIGLLKMIDGGEEDDKIIAVYNDDPRFSDIKDIKQLSQHISKEIKHFFATYKALENKEVEVKDVQGLKEAKASIKHSIALYDKNFSK